MQSIWTASLHIHSVTLIILHQLMEGFYSYRLKETELKEN